jgi:hypothetical protein
MDTGSQVIDDYDTKMPFKFSGTLQNVQIITDERSARLEEHS